MDTRQFIDQLAAGESADAKETLENLISNKAFETLDEYKKQIASGIFNGKSEDPEPETDEEQKQEQ